MWTYLLIFIFAALFGFVYGKKAHLKQLSNILLQQGMPIDQVSKLSECVRTYNISNLKEGYSVICDNAEGKYHEVFKYATKGIFKETEDGTPLNGYNDFVPLYYTLYRRKLIQGYGLLNKYKFEITLELDAKADEEYNRIIDVLRELESPERVFEYLTEIQSQLQTKEVTYISRASVAQLMADDYGE